MTSEAASGEEEASRSDRHHDKGKGKETASTPGAHTALFPCRVCVLNSRWFPNPAAAPSGSEATSDDVLDPNLYLQVAQEPQPQSQEHAPSDEMVIGGSSEQQQQHDGQAVEGQESSRAQSPATQEKGESSLEC